jgi:hypothetical protein
MSGVVPRVLFLEYLAALAGKGAARSHPPGELRYAMSAKQAEAYRKRIQQMALAREAGTVAPDVLFRAADAALDGDVANSEARIGLQPGTMDPIHFGHLAAALGGALDADLDFVFLACGATVPDKPRSSAATDRQAMATIAVDEFSLRRWLRISNVRQQVATAFGQDAEALAMTGNTATQRRSTLDLAAFIWLFRANPRAKWVYLVGSDKIAAYGKNGEEALVRKTLGHTSVNAQVVFFSRSADPVDVAVHIAPYPWLRALWESGFFRASNLTSGDLSASSIRAAVGQRRDEVLGIPLADCVSPGVLQYIQENPALIERYCTSLSSREPGRT